jgi:hypothetical protein
MCSAARQESAYRGDEVKVENAREDLCGGTQGRSGRAHTGIVHQPVDPSVALEHGADYALAIALQGHVAGDDLHARAELRP